MVNRAAVEYHLAWAFLVMVISIGVLGIVYQLLRGPHDHFIHLAQTQTPEAAQDRVNKSLAYHTNFWQFIPVTMFISVIVWGVVRAIIERRGSV